MSGDNVKLFVGNLPLDATHDELTKLFSPFGEINTCSLLRQYAFVTLKGEGAADRAIRNLDGKEYRGRPLVVEESRARPPNSTKVFVGNLAATCSADDLHGLFSTYGRVLDCDKVKARLCSNVGYAFVHMERKEEALVAIEGLNGTNYKGRHLQWLEITTVDQEGTVQQSVHNSFYNTTTFDPTYAALKGITSANGADGVIYDALASQVYGTVADQVYKDMSNHNSAAVAPVTEADSQNGPDPTTLFEAARAKFFQEGQKVLAEQQIGRKGAENERDRSPIRGNRAPLLPDPVPGSFGQIRQKRRALLPTPPGAPEESPAATNTPEGSDPVARSYEEYYQQLHQYQQYQQYQQQQQYQYLQYAYTNPPPPPPPAPPATTQASTTAPAPPGTYSAPPTYAAPGAYPPPGTYDASGGYAAPPGSYDASGGYGPPGAYAAAGSYSTSTPYEQTAAHGQPMPQRHDYPYHTPEPPYR
ncbi:hypothetical protein JOQ06_019193 [Pogonophryne albipinna]|uniref:RNA-binding protein 14 n=1 Tax=Pogonophryne albipinna TaxID=1090488 RepID=A0AAD6AT48_9TELE|nr:hypothetical protein JOQ06_019193 [Pogonophryne albipinna]